MATILVVDNEQSVEVALAKELTGNGFDVILLNTAVDLCERLEAGPVDAIVMEMNMPEVDGCEATRALRGIEAIAGIPVILCATEPLPGDEERARESGCSWFLKKPFTTSDLQSALGSIFGNATSSESDVLGSESEPSEVTTIEVVTLDGSPDAQLKTA